MSKLSQNHDQIKPEFTALTVSTIRRNITENAKVMDVLSKTSVPETRRTIQAFLDNDRLDDQIADILNSLKGEMLETKAVARMSYKLPLYNEVKDLNIYYSEKGKLSLAKTLLNGLLHMKLIKRKEEVKRDFEATGKAKYRKVVSLIFKGQESAKDITRGLHMQPGELLSYFVHTKPGGKQQRLSKEEKYFHKDLSSHAFRVVRVTENTLRSYYTQTKWYNEAMRTKNEDPILLKERVEKYISIIKDLEKEDRIYLSTWNDSRRRLYYELTMLGLNPQGDSFETHMWESADARVINQQGLEDLIWAAVVIATGRKNKAQALKYWAKHEDKVRVAMLDDEEFDFGEIFYHKRMLAAINCALDGTPSRFLLGFDATTAGLQHFGLAFNSVKSMRTSNFGGLKTVKDAHKELGEIFGMDRKQAKLINLPLLHGSTMKTVADIVSSDDKDYSINEVTELIQEAYGEEIVAVPQIADWGSIAYNNENTSLFFSAPDGWKAQSTAYSPSVKLEVYGLDIDSKKGYNQCTVHRDMPLVITAKGETIHEDSKLRGLYANITHMIDGWDLREIVREVNGTILLKHDKYYVHPNDMHQVRVTYKKCALIEQSTNLYKRAMKEVAENHKGSSKLLVPELAEGKGTKQMVIDSQNYLMP